MANQYQDYGVPPPSYGQEDSGQGGYGSSDGYGGGYSRGGGGGFNKGGSFGGNRGGYKGGSSGGGGGAEIVTQTDTVFVSGMDPEATEYQIDEHFGSIGIIKKDRRTQKPKIWIYRNKETGTGKGECTITYDDSHTASSAIDWFDGKDFNGFKIKVSLAQRNNTWQNKGGPRGGRGGFGGGGGGGGGGRGGFGGNDDRPPRGGGDDRGSRGGGREGGGQSREGDWLCSSCQNKNFAWRNECNRCKEPKGDDAGSGGRGGPPQRGGFQSRDRPSGGGGGGYGGGRGGGGGGGRGGFGGGDRGGDRGGAMRGGDRFSGGNRQRPY